MLLAGEPGIGKTRLVSELANTAEERGYLVSWGRSQEAIGAPPLWPWIDALSPLVRARKEANFGDVDQVMSRQLAQLFTEMSGADEHVSDTGRDTRHALFEALRRLLADAATDQPRLVILEDLHWSDPESLLLLEYITPHLAEMRVLLLATYRDVEITRTHPLGNTLGALSASTTERIELRRLDAAETTALITEQAGREVSAELAAMVHSRTEGNPFFVREIAQLVSSDSDDLGAGAGAGDATRIPAGVREAIGRRLNTLDPHCNQMLRAAAVLGRAFDYQLLGSITELPPEALDWLDDAVTHAILQESEQHFGQFEFRHHLIREVLLEELTTARRMRFHKAAVEALRDAPARALRGNMTTLPQHVLYAAPIMEPADAAELLLEAGREAAQRYAWQSAIGFLEPAFELLDPTDEELGEIYVRVGTAYGLALRHAGRQVEAGALLDDVAVLSIKLELPELAVRAVVARSMTTGAESGGFGAAEVMDPLFKGVIAMSEVVPAADRVQLLMAQADSIYHAATAIDHEARARAYADRALAAARQSGDQSLVVEALTRVLHVTSYVELWGTAEPLRAELKALSERLDDPNGKMFVTWIEIHRDETAGDLDRIEILHEQRLEELSRRYEDPRAGRGRNPAIWLATLRGDFAAALEGLALAASEQDFTQSPMSHGRHMDHALAVHRCLGTVDQMLHEARSVARTMSQQDGTTVDAFLALLATEAGDLDEARSYLDMVVRDHFRSFEDDQDRLRGLVSAADACLAVGDAEIAQALYAQLIVFKGGNPNSELGANGSSHRQLAKLSAIVGENDRAREHFEAALEFNRRMNASPWLAWTEIDYAEWLVQHPSSDDRSRARQLAESARRTALELGMTPTQQRCDLLLSSVEDSIDPKHDAGLTERERDVLRLLASGCTNIEIGEGLVISVRTVERHITNIYGKIEARGRADATAYAIQHHLS